MTKLIGLAAILSTLTLGCFDTAGDISGGGQNPGGADAGPGEQQCRDLDKKTYYLDSDGDGQGDPNMSTTACSQPTGYSAAGTDCDDSEPTVYEGATEYCGDKLDNDCTGGDPCVGNLRAHWSFDDQIGPNAVDYSLNGHAGVLQGGLVHTAESSLTFDGVDDYVEVPHALEFELSSGSVSFWFMPDAIGVQQSMVSKDSSGNDQGGHMSFYLNADGNVRVRLQSNQQTFEIVTLTPVLGATWTHVAFAFGGTEGMKLYVNGALAGVNPYTGGINRNLEPLAIGAGTDNSGNLTAQPINNQFAGKIADVQLYDRKLSLEEVMGLRMVSAPLGATL